MINGREWILAARFGKTSTHILFRHVFDDAREVFHDVAIAVNDFMLLLIHELSPGIRLTFNAFASPNQVERLVSRVPDWDGTRHANYSLAMRFSSLAVVRADIFRTASSSTQQSFCCCL